MERKGNGGLDGIDEQGLVGKGGIGLDDVDATEGGYRDGHEGLSDDVHRGGDDGEGEGDAAGEAGCEVDAMPVP